MRYLPVTLLVAAVLGFAGCGGGGSSKEKVWCVAPGEKVTPSFKRAYPELYIAKAACDAIKKG